MLFGVLNSNLALIFSIIYILCDIAEFIMNKLTLTVLLLFVHDRPLVHYYRILKFGLNKLDKYLIVLKNENGDSFMKEINFIRGFQDVLSHENKNDLYIAM